ncbi:hypothetical protein H4S02_000064 [Coemansia sp. RSA 2611]|nr:hypothetical protein H4S02_000064 [Coemansia sp. RSA 2611]
MGRLHDEDIEFLEGVRRGYHAFFQDCIYEWEGKYFRTLCMSDMEKLVSMVGPDDYAHVQRHYGLDVEITAKVNGIELSRSTYGVDMAETLWSVIIRVDDDVVGSINTNPGLADPGVDIDDYVPTMSFNKQKYSLDSNAYFFDLYTFPPPELVVKYIPKKEWEKAHGPFNKTQLRMGF